MREAIQDIELSSATAEAELLRLKGRNIDKEVQAKKAEERLPLPLPWPSKLNPATFLRLFSAVHSASNIRIDREYMYV